MNKFSLNGSFLPIFLDSSKKKAIKISESPQDEEEVSEYASEIEKIKIIFQDRPENNISLERIALEDPFCIDRNSTLYDVTTGRFYEYVNISDNLKIPVCLDNMNSVTIYNDILYQIRQFGKSIQPMTKCPFSKTEMECFFVNQKRISFKSIPYDPIKFVELLKHPFNIWNNIDFQKWKVKKNVNGINICLKHSCVIDPPTILNQHQKGHRKLVSHVFDSIIESQKKRKLNAD